MTALVTGATGFLGSHLAERLLLAGRRVRVLARDPARAGFLRGLGAEVVAGDLTAPASLSAQAAGLLASA